jgi:hypothetical protein
METAVGYLKVLPQNLPEGTEDNNENSRIRSRDDSILLDMNISSKVRLKVNSPKPTSHFVIISDIKRPNRVKTKSKTAYTPAKNVFRVSK